MENLKADTQDMSTYEMKEKFGGIVVPLTHLCCYFLITTAVQLTSTFLAVKALYKKEHSHKNG